MRSIGTLTKAFIVISLFFSFPANGQTISWSSERGPYSGSIQLITVDPSADIFAATTNGMYRSTDAGNNWQRLDIALEYGSAFLLSDSAGNIYNGNGTEGLYLSTDKGTTWAKSTLSGGAYSAAIISGNRICVGGLQTVSISSDLGKTWSISQLTTDNGVEVLAVAQDYEGNLYAGLQSFHPKPPALPSGGGVYVSSDSGATWTFDGMQTTTISSIAATRAGKVFNLSANGISSALLKSSQWQGDETGISSLGGTVETLISDNSGDAVIVTTAGLLVYSGSAWTVVAPKISLASITSAFYNPQGATYAGTDGSGLYSLDKSSAEWYQCGIVLCPVTSIEFDGTGTLFAGTQNGVYENKPDGKWQRFSDGLANSTVNRLFFSPFTKRLYALSTSGMSYLPDQGLTWILLTQLPSNDIVESGQEIQYVSVNGGLLISSAENGWSPIPTIGLPNTNIFCLCLDSAGDLYAGTALNGIFISTDEGNFWQQTGISSPFIFYSVRSIHIDAHGRIFAGTDTAGAFFSDDGGTSWNAIPTILGKDITSLYLSSPSLYLAGSADRGIFVSTDRGSNWHSANEGLTDSTIFSLRADRQGGLYAGTNQGLFKSSVTLKVPEQSPALSFSYSLKQNYPNPFNPRTTIGYQLPVSSRVTLNVYDELGRLVAQLINGREAAGMHTAFFDGSRLGSGVYFCRLTAGSYTATKKMILLK